MVVSVYVDGAGGEKSGYGFFFFLTGESFYEEKLGITNNQAEYYAIISALKKFQSKLDPRKYNGAIFLGLQSPLVKSHGGTDSIGFAHSINVCNQIVKSDLIDRIKSNLITIDDKI